MARSRSQQLARKLGSRLDYREARALPGNEKMEVTATEQAAWETCSLKAKKKNVIL